MATAQDVYDSIKKMYDILNEQIPLKEEGKQLFIDLGDIEFIAWAINVVDDSHLIFYAVDRDGIFAIYRDVSTLASIRVYAKSLSAAGIHSIPPGFHIQEGNAPWVAR